MPRFGVRPHHDVWVDAALLACESSCVMAMRLAMLAGGGRLARREANRMVTEKFSAAWGAGLTLMAGGTDKQVIRHYRKRVAANARRLTPRRKRRI